jgi:hypothetical protein
MLNDEWDRRCWSPDQQQMITPVVGQATNNGDSQTSTSGIRYLKFDGS